MSGSLMKYFSDRGGAGTSHNDNLHWPGTASGFPLRGPTAPLLRGEEYETQVTHTIDFHSRMFRLWDAEDKKAFDMVRDRICNSWYVEFVRHDRWSDEHMGLIVWMEWGQIYGEATNGKSITPPI